MPNAFDVISDRIIEVVLAGLFLAALVAILFSEGCAEPKCWTTTPAAGGAMTCLSWDFGASGPCFTNPDDLARYVASSHLKLCGVAAGKDVP